MFVLATCVRNVRSGCLAAADSRSLKIADDALLGYCVLILEYLPSNFFFSSSCSVWPLSSMTAFLTLSLLTCANAEDVLTPW